MIELYEVLDAYFECRKSKRKTHNAINFEIDYLEYCWILCNDINNNEYEIEKSIAFIVDKPKLREIFAANFRDRIVHHIIIKKLNGLFENYFIPEAYNCRKKKGTLFGIKRLYSQTKECSENYTKPCYIAKFDLKNFFMSIDKNILLNKLKVFVNNNYFEDDKELLLKLIEIIVLNCPQKNCYKKSSYKLWNKLPKLKSLFYNDENFGLPIGNLSSLIFANFFLTEFDIFVSKHFKYYGRYVDDFFIVSNSKLEILEFIPKIREFLKEIKMTLHNDKFYILYVDKGCKFIGGVVKRNRMYISNRTVNNCIYYLKYICPYETNINKVICVLNSYFGFLIHYKSTKIKDNLFNMIPMIWKSQLKLIQFKVTKL